MENILLGLIGGFIALLNLLIVFILNSNNKRMERLEEYLFKSSSTMTRLETRVGDLDCVRRSVKECVQ